VKARTITKKPDKAAMFAIIKRARGILKRKPGGKSFDEEWAEHKREEIELEQAKLLRMERAGLLPMKRNSNRSKKEIKTH
jgi:hypothetical protein